MLRGTLTQIMGSRIIHVFVHVGRVKPLYVMRYCLAERKAADVCNVRGRGKRFWYVRGHKMVLIYLN